ncbi:hypothetical protein BGW38_004803 [Lunasporangiospora selenospora]|uniref:Uncharacterized protein n=1 Tax=Lunasporangiospora selenospora TaxID=979761 RepID=A0A9P6G0K4_9FUNG|nr:hypothetical protein BGW38_004803 [Lunasporangiospora selenospora]
MVKLSLSLATATIMMATVVSAMPSYSQSVWEGDSSYQNAKECVPGETLKEGQIFKLKSTELDTIVSKAGDNIVGGRKGDKGLLDVELCFVASPFESSCTSEGNAECVKKDTDYYVRVNQPGDWFITVNNDKIGITDNIWTLVLFSLHKGANGGLRVSRNLWWTFVAWTTNGAGQQITTEFIKKNDPRQYFTVVIPPKNPAFQCDE